MASGVNTPPPTMEWNEHRGKHGTAVKGTGSARGHGFTSQHLRGAHAICNSTSRQPNTSSGLNRHCNTQACVQGKYIKLKKYKVS